MRGRRNVTVWVDEMLTCWVWLFDWLFSWLRQPIRRRRLYTCRQAPPIRRVFAQPKPKWVKHEIIRLKALIPQAGCQTVAHHFNRRWQH